MIYDFPDLGLEDVRVLEEISGMRAELAEHLRAPRRWTGRLRRTALARAIQGSNSIEGYHVELDDADAALDDEEPLSADQRTFAEIRGYRQALGYVLAMARDEHFVLDASALRSMHFMMLAHDLGKSPGQYRSREIYVHDERTEQVVYTGPAADSVPTLMAELVSDLNRHDGEDALVHAAMAHLNVVMIHPFRDGNGRMARALQTLVLARRGVAEPEFASIEEWLGANTDDYYRVLAITGRGAWHPERDASLWVSFNLRAHHMQAQTVRDRWRRAQRSYEVLDRLVAVRGLPDRTIDALYSGLLGFRLRRPTYVEQTGVDERTASRDFKALADAGLLRPVGETKGRHYVAGAGLEEVRREVGPSTPPVDPYPSMRHEIAVRAVAGPDPQVA
ncbi:Fic family protein [Cellulomonas soli]|uniref:Cell division protein Fic n=1 Tax=Cellulomonas soli TaxID=931535 RepID=A0A512PGM1_9CELL|nr:Fic family protein [Cellulomonas soli]NYI58212.1 Fic family protein [Cellulomonas soli]GEP70344.1 cell division protein Fic [Cellulomonas soli]